MCFVIYLFLISYKSAQSLWNLRRFRNEFLRRPPACFNLMHEGPCITEQLYEIFSACEKNEHYRMTLLLTDVKTTLCKIVDDNNIFQKVYLQYHLIASQVRFIRTINILIWFTADVTLLLFCLPQFITSFLYDDCSIFTVHRMKHS